MRLRKVKNAEQIIQNNKYIINNPEEYKGRWNELFNNNNPIQIEIGMGKGDFIIDKALRNKDINYIGIEKFPSVILRAVEKLEKLEEIDNLILINLDAENIENIFLKEIDLIYLNFSDPWPKKRHAKRRLTNPIYLNKYKSIVKNKLNIEMKTDNLELFNYSLLIFENMNFKIIEKSNDYAQNINNISKTEYEKKFINLGKKINFVKIEK